MNVAKFPIIDKNIYPSRAMQFSIDKKPAKKTVFSLLQLIYT